jgi:hypothetical protein
MNFTDLKYVCIQWYREELSGTPNSFITLFIHSFLKQNLSKIFKKSLYSEPYLLISYQIIELYFEFHLLLFYSSFWNSLSSVNWISINSKLNVNINFSFLTNSYPNFFLLFFKLFNVSWVELHLAFNNNQRIASNLFIWQKKFTVFCKAWNLSWFEAFTIDFLSSLLSN